MSDDETLFSGEEDQPDLFEVGAEWKDLWRGMPAYDHEDMEPHQSVLVHFRRPSDRNAFAKLVGQTLNPKTKFIWYPEATIGHASHSVYTSATKMVPRYPVYIISKGRWESRLTSRSLEWIKVPYHIVIEPQEYDKYAAVIDPKKILTLPFSNLGLGGIPARNWVYEHAVASGARRHWILDDNIAGFCRFHANLKVEVDNGATFCALEDWVDRYENVAMAGFNYDYFAPRKQGARVKPITLNTRVYSGILLDNAIPHRWRGRYNEDTDLSLRILKDGLCTALFNAFLMYKMPTLTMKGGNTDELYKGAEALNERWNAHCTECAKGCTPDETPRCEIGREILSADGRWLMADSLAQQHPDVTTVERKWGRWQHQVDYRRFRANELKLKPGVVIRDEVNDYGMELADMPNDTDYEARVVRRTASTASITTAKAAPQVQPTGQAIDVLSLLAKTPEKAEEPAASGPGAASEARLEASIPLPAETLPASPGQLEAALAAALKKQLEGKGHRVLTREGKLFISDASRLTPEDREQIHAVKPDLLALADPWPEDKAAEIPQPSTITSSQAVQATLLEASGTSLAQLLGTAPPRPAESDWRPDEPPSLDGIPEVVLNFATDGLRWAQGDRPGGVTVATPDGQKTWFLPFRFKYGGNLDEAQVKRWAQTELRGKTIRNANTHFDIHMAREWGVDLVEMGCAFSDIQHTAALLDDRRKQFRLDKLAADYLPGLPGVGRLDESQHLEHHASEAAERERHTARLVGLLWQTFQPLLKEQELEAVQHLEDEVIPAVIEMEKNGQPVDVELLEQYHAECVRLHGQLMREVADEAGFAFDGTNKGYQRLFERFGLPPTDSIAGDVITVIDHPTVKKAYLASQYASLDSKTFKAYKELIDAKGILRFDINQLRSDEGGTVSGRFSIGYVQQVPNADNHRAVFGEALFPRRIFIAAGGHDYLEADAMQIEQRLLVHYAGNEKIIKEYEGDLERLQRGEETVSYHRVTHRMIQAYKPDMLYSHQKNFNFAFQYGAKSIKLAVMMGFITAAEGDEIRRLKRWDDPKLRTIKEIEQAYHRMFPEAGALIDRAAHLAKSQCDDFCKRGDALHRQYPHRGFIKTYLGRRSRFPDNYKTYIALNRVLQGTGADIMKRKLKELHDARRHTGLVMRLTVHDAVCGDATLPETQARVSEVLNAQSYPFKVPILWSCGTGKTWADCK